MQSVKTTEKKDPRALVAVEEKIGKLPGRIVGFLSKNKKRTLIVFGSILLIGGAILLNWKLFGDSAGKDYALKDPVSDGAPADGSAGDGTDGAAGGSDSYFAMAVIDRQKARDEAMEVLQLVVDSNDAGDEERQQALDGISEIASNIEKEANIESLVKAKGFADCVAVIHDGAINVIVETPETLLANQVAQITEIVYEQGIDPVNLTIVEKAPV